MSQGFWWLSFVDPDLPEGERFLGATLVEGRCMEDAVGEAWRKGINPGGDVCAVFVPDRVLPELLQYRNRLVSKEEMNDDGQFSQRDRARMM